MKLYRVIVKDRTTKNTIMEATEHASTEKQIKLKFKIKYPFAIITATRVPKVPGVQVDLEDMIKEIEEEQNGNISN